MSTETITDRIIAVDYDMSLQDVISVGNYDHAYPGITQEKFPVEGRGTKKFRTKLFKFGRKISSKNAVARMKAENFTPGGHVHGIAYGATFPEEQREHGISCLGSSAQVRSNLSVVCLSGDSHWRSVELQGWDDVWDSDWRFLGVQEVSGA